MTRGSIVFENWKKESADNIPVRSYEVPVFTDAHINGQLLNCYGPYTFMNAVAYSAERRLQPAIVVRYQDQMSGSYQTKLSRKTDDSTYHGGTFLDELAALISISLGIRAAAGNNTREFTVESGVMGRPINLYAEWPSLLRNHKSPMVPSLLRDVDINDLTTLESYPLLTPEMSIAIMRCARLYQEAVWIADSAPEMSWLFLVSSVETAAGCWRRTEDTPVSRMEISKPDLVTLLRDQGGDELVEKVAAQLADSLGSTKKFVDFLIKHLPPEPEIRPPTHALTDWNAGAIRKALRLIYGYRSKALHAGIPFPAPLCMPPSNAGPGIPYDERPPGLTHAASGGEWTARDLPMHLHVFEYISRNAILSWWKSGTPTEQDELSAGGEAPQK